MSRPEETRLQSGPHPQFLDVHKQLWQLQGALVGAVVGYVLGRLSGGDEENKL